MFSFVYETVRNVSRTVVIFVFYFSSLIMIPEVTRESNRPAINGQIMSILYGITSAHKHVYCTIRTEEADIYRRIEPLIESTRDVTFAWNIRMLIARGLMKLEKVIRGYWIGRQAASQLWLEHRTSIKKKEKGEEEKEKKGKEIDPKENPLCNSTWRVEEGDEGL